MARAFPFLPDPFGFDPPLSILDTLAVPGAAGNPADGQGLSEAILSVVHSSDEAERGNSPTPSAGVDLESVEAAANAADPMAGLVTFAFDSGAETGSSVSAIQPPTNLPTPDIEVPVHHGTEGPGTAPAADSMAVDVASAAKGGPGGGGAGGGGGSGVLTDYRSGSQNGDAGYDIWIQFKGSGWTADLQQEFKDAANYLTTVITADIGGGGRIGKVLVDDLYVTAEVRTIDGVGNVLGQAGPTNVWTANELTAAGQMQFDVADALTYQNKGLWDDIVTHELMHVLGFGSLWNYGANPLVSGTHYNGANGVAAYDAATPGTQTYIPVEDGGGSGTAGAHWDEEALINELMTGYINDDGNAATSTDNYLSRFSVMSLADLGYAVTNYQDYPHDGVII